MMNQRLTDFLGLRPHNLPLAHFWFERAEDGVWLSCKECYSASGRNLACDCSIKVPTVNFNPYNQIKLTDCHVVARPRNNEVFLVRSSTLSQGRQIFLTWPYHQKLVEGLQKTCWLSNCEEIIAILEKNNQLICCVKSFAGIKWFDITCSHKSFEPEPDTRKWCCEQKCKERPRFLCDGEACSVCECMNYCRCKCKTFVESLSEGRLMRFRLKSMPRILRSKIQQCEAINPSVAPYSRQDTLELQSDLAKAEFFVKNINSVIFSDYSSWRTEESFRVHLPGCKTYAVEFNNDTPFFEELMELQMDDNVQTNESSVHDMVQEEPVEVIRPKQKRIMAPSLITPKAVNDQSELAMTEVTVTPGTTTSRVVTTLPTPNGPKPVIHMTNDKPITIASQNHAPRMSLPEIGNYWAHCQATAGHYASRFSQKTKYIMRLYQFYTSLSVWRIVAKPPLFSTQRFWVSYVPAKGKNFTTDNLGFEWNPTEEPEIYVLTPYTSVERMLQTDLALPETLVITPLTECLYVDGQPTSIPIDVYCAPSNMELYVPTLPDVAADRYFFNAFQLSPGTYQIVSATSFIPYAGDGTELSSDNGTNLQEHVGSAKKWVADLNAITSIFAPVDAIITPLRYQEEIFENIYSESWTEDIMDYGETGNHTKRVDTHWSVFSRTVWSASDLVKNYELSQFESGLAYSDALRHLFYSHYPTFKVFCSSIPTSNMLFRITQHPHGIDSLTLDEALTLPGLEFDPKEGPVSFKPYWNRETSALTQDDKTLKFSIHKISGTMGAEPIAMTIMYNCSSVNYHHLNNDVTPMELYHEQIGVSEDDPIKTTPQPKGGFINKLDEAPTTSERKWTYLNTFRLPNDGLALQLPINALMAGSQVWNNLRRYTLLRGKWHFKIVSPNNRLVNGNLHVFQTNRLFDSPNVASELLKNIGYSVSSVTDGAIEYTTQWRTLAPNVPITDTEEQQLGYLTVVLPEVSGVFGIEDTLITLYVDPSDLEFKCETAPQSYGEWFMPAATIVARNTV